MANAPVPTKLRAAAIVLPVPDVATAAAYYRDKLGFAVAPGEPDGTGACIVAERGAVEIRLVPKDQPPGVWILVDSVDEMTKELLARGARFESGPTNQEYGHRDFLISDLDGYNIG